jgi:NAD(P)-dependent dehydrogenase (short-subunit alcohol dehydrogenase family)
LTQQSLTDPFLVDFIMDLRDETKNELINAEHVDLSSLHSIRLFATKWIDNAPPRRLDMVILCASILTPAGGKASITEDGVESNWGVNYMANFQLLSILSPAIRAQPPDRDVRIIFGMCSSYMGGSLAHLSTAGSGKGEKARKQNSKEVYFTPSSAYATSKFALFAFAQAFQKHLSGYQRPDKMPMTAKVITVDPGFSRTPGMRRYLSFGSLWGLLIYLVMWPLWWLILKSPEQGAQSFLFAAMEGGLREGDGGVLIKECKVVKILRDEVNDEGLQKALWEESDKTVQALEKIGATKRAKEKKAKEETEAREKAEKELADAKARTPPEKQPGSRRSKKKA